MTGTAVPKMGSCDRVPRRAERKIKLGIWGRYPREARVLSAYYLVYSPTATHTAAQPLSTFWRPHTWPTTLTYTDRGAYPSSIGTDQRSAGRRDASVTDGDGGVTGRTGCVTGNSGPVDPGDSTRTAAVSSRFVSMEIESMMTQKRED